MLFIIAIVLIFVGVLTSAVESAVLSIEEIERLKSSLIDKIKWFKKRPFHFSFSVAILKFLILSLALILLGVWTQGKLGLFLLVCFIAVVSFYIAYLLNKFAKDKPELAIKLFTPLLIFIFLLFKLSFALPEKFIYVVSTRDVNFLRRELEFFIQNTNQVEIQNENQLLRNVLEFNDKTVREIMIPRTKVVAIDINAPREKVVKVVLSEGYSRLPVYKDTIDNIVGIVYAKDLINYIEEPNLFVLYDLLRPAYFVPETKKISDLLRELQRQKIHIAIVVDEFGGFKGIVTLEDIIEEIVGEIHDEYDKVEKNYELLEDGSVIVDAGMLVSDLNKKFDFDIPEGTDYESIGGFVSKLAGKIPGEGDKIKFKDLIFEVTKKSKRKIIELKISKAKTK